MATTIQPAGQAAMNGRLKHFATCWRLLRTDGIIFRWTDHDTSILVGDTAGNQIYLATPVRSTARQKTTGLEGANVELSGPTTGSGITFNDLRAGRYRDAQVDEFLVNWRFPFSGAIMQTHYWVQSISFDSHRWVAQLSGVSALLQRPFGDVFGRTCRWKLGDAKCTVDLDDFDEAFTITNIQDAHRQFNASGMSSKADGYWQLGHIEWSTGANAGLVSEIKRSLNTGRFVETQLPTPYPMVSGDTGVMFPGCEKTTLACNSKFNNLVNFGGFPRIPGEDTVLATVGKKSKLLDLFDLG